MATAHDPKEKAGPHAPRLTPEELARRNDEAIRLLDSFEADGDEAEQEETMAFLRQALGPDRVISSRSLFP